MSFFMAGTDTHVGKTWCSALLAAYLGWHYWKPIQTGKPTDSSFVSAKGIPVLPEQYVFSEPAAPSLAAKSEGLSISLEKFSIPELPVIAEGAGGLLVPLNDSHTMLDLIAHLRLEVILVGRTTLGTINHVLMSHSLLIQRNIPIRCIILNGTTCDPRVQTLIAQYTTLPVMILPFYSSWMHATIHSHGLFQQLLGE